MTTKMEIAKAVDDLARGRNLVHGSREFRRWVLLACLQTFSAQFAPNARSSAAALAGIAVLRERCGVPAEDGIEAQWIAARLVGVASDESIVVDTVVSAVMVLSAGGLARQRSVHPRGIILTELERDEGGQHGALRVPDAARVAVVSRTGRGAGTERVSGNTLARIRVMEMFEIALYGPGREGAALAIDMPRIDRQAGAALDRIPVRHRGVRRGHPDRHGEPRSSHQGYETAAAAEKATAA